MGGASEPSDGRTVGTGSAHQADARGRGRPGSGPPPAPGLAVWTLGRALDYAVTHLPWTWRVLRRPVQRFFDAAAADWDDIAQPHAPGYLTALQAALEWVTGEVGRSLDVGTGTGVAAFLTARRYPAAEVLGIDISREMVAQASAKAARMYARPQFLVADVAAPEFSARFAESFDLITLLNAVPFFGPLARLLRPSGFVACAASYGPQTPSFTPPSVLGRGFEHCGLRTLRVGTAGEGTYYVAQRS
jgi:SAM-dependent methyltransferase